MKRQFFGSQNVALDVKNRLSIPSRYRTGEYEAVDEVFMLVVLGKYPHIDFFFSEEAAQEEIDRRLEKFSPNTPDDIVDLLTNGYFDRLSLDKQGRTAAINAHYLQIAQLKRETVVVGSGSYFSVYDSSLFDSYLAEVTELRISRYNAQLEATKRDDNALSGRVKASGGTDGDYTQSWGNE